MNDATIAEAFARNGAIYEKSHFVFQKGEHGPNYVDKELVEIDAIDTSDLCQEIAIRLPGKPFHVDAVVGPALGAIALAHSLAWHISTLAGRRISTIFARKGEEKSFVIHEKFRRFLDGKNALVVEDVLNSGESAGRSIDATRLLGANVVGLAALCNRGGVKPADVGLTEKDVFITLYNVAFPKYPAESCPLCAAGVPIDRRAGHWKEFLTSIGQQ